MSNLQVTIVKLIDLMIKASSHLYRLMRIIITISIFVGLLGSLIWVLNPALDDDVVRAIIQSLLSNYDALDIEQKDKIRQIFSEIFLTR